MILLIKYPYIAAPYTIVAKGNFLSKKFGEKVLAGNTDFKNSLNCNRNSNILRISLQQKDRFLVPA